MKHAVLNTNTITEPSRLHKQTFQHVTLADSQASVPVEKRENIPISDSCAHRLTAIGAHIKTLRIQKGYTSAEIFAYEHDLNRISYWRMERGCNITMNSLLRILDIHKITLSEFFKDID